MAGEAPAGSGSAGDFTVFIIGGSQGASRINQAVTGALTYLTDKTGFFFIHQTGQAEEEAVRRIYQQAGVACQVAAFIDDMAACYARADLLVCRAGATTVAEIVCMGKPCILVPFPYAADDHQTENARALVEAGGAEMIPERELTERGIAEKIVYYAASRAKLKEMGRRLRAAGKPEAGRIIAGECLALMAATKKRRMVKQACT
jgi:UDP-N-acetylglucosamine--N-acetylmuramyl-(pentapeptide) pyrophosphoryl-undecaprenol N-acetylglucosamine transferase